MRAAILFPKNLAFEASDIVQREIEEPCPRGGIRIRLRIVVDIRPM